MFVNLCHIKPSPKAHGVPNAQLHTHPTVLALGHCEQTKLKAKHTWGFQQYSPHMDPQERVSKVMKAKAYREVQHKTKWWDLEVEKKFHMGRWECNDRENEELYQ